MVVARSRCETSTSTRWRSLMRSRSARLARSVSSRIGAGLGVVEERARHPAARKLPQVLDAGHVVFMARSQRFLLALVGQGVPESGS